MAQKNICIPALLLSLTVSMLTMPSRAYSSAPSAFIKVLILEDDKGKMPGKDEKITPLGNMKGDLLSGDSHYSGDIEVLKGYKGLYVINKLPLEAYIESVVASEAGSEWDLEALKAQAVVSRTYAVFRKNLNQNSLFHLTSSVLHQAYKGNNPNVRISYAVRETAGEILTYNGKPIEAFYHSTCGGRTENAEEVFGKSYPYLRSVEAKCELSPYWIWKRNLTGSEVEAALNIRDIRDMTIISRTSTGRAKEVSIESGAGASVIRATELRKLLGWNKLPSTNFTVKMNGKDITFEGKGYGHGVGLCQWSALQMAREGKTYKEILSFFYPDTRIIIYEGD